MELKARVSFNPEKVFYKAYFFKEWAIKSKNKKTKLKLIKKAEKELNKVTREEFKSNIRIEMVKGEE